MAIWFEAHHPGNLNEWTASELNNESGVIEASATRAKEGTHAAYAVLIDPVGGDYARCHKTGLDLGVGINIYISGWWWFCAGFNLTNPLYLSKLEENPAAYKGIKTNLNGSEQLYIYDDINSATYSQGSPISVPIGQWVGIETRIYTHQSAGIIELWQDCDKIIEVTGIDTMPATNFLKLLYGAYYNTGDQTYDIELFFDEIFVQSTQKILPSTAVPRFNPLNLKRFGGL